MHVIQTKQLSKSYGERVGVAELDLVVEEGSVFGLLGPNGAGKTTTMRLLLGFLHADTGSAQVFDLDCARQSARVKRELGYLPGDLRLPLWMTGREALRIMGAVRGRDLQASGRELGEYLELDLSLDVRSMSRGMRQKLGILLALAHEPRLLILDEPTSALDPVTQARLYDRLRRLADGGVTIFFSSHVLSEVEGLCDRVAILRHGKLVANQPLDELRACAGRAVSILWSPGTAPESAPPGLAELRHEGNLWQGLLTGPVRPLIDWLRPLQYEDLVIEEPDLDSLFLRYYADDDTGGPA
jgi:beta-exotoxin I transport system ATP-binding protein